MIKMSKNQLQQLEQTASKAGTEWAEISRRIVSIKSGLDMEIKVAENIKNSLNQISFCRVL